jgi:hypothetical protein
MSKNIKNTVLFLACAVNAGLTIAKTDPLASTSISAALTPVASTSGASISGASISGASISGASISGASISGASISGASISGASISGASISGASISGASISGASISGASISGASTSGASTSGASISVASTPVAATQVAATQVVSTSTAPLTVVTLPTDTGLASADVALTKAYVGLVWTLGNASLMPDAVVGLRHSKTKVSSGVSGYDVSARFKLGAKLAFGSVRAVYLDGKRSSQWNVGLGYSATHQSAFGTFGASAEYLKLGLDYVFKPAKIDAFVELNTLEKPVEVKSVPTLGPV